MFKNITFMCNTNLFMSSKSNSFVEHQYTKNGTKQNIKKARQSKAKQSKKKLILLLNQSLQKSYTEKSTDTEQNSNV